MELVDGRTLRDELDARSFLPPAEAVSIASSICQALDVAHKAGIVHRDVKPAHVLLSSSGQLKVADFGIAKAARGGEEDLPDLTAIEIGRAPAWTPVPHAQLVCRLLHYKQKHTAYQATNHTTYP